MIDGDGRILFIAILIAFIVAVGIGIKYDFFTGVALYFAMAILVCVWFPIKFWFQHRQRVRNN
jgi:hypothetical protein